MVRPESGLWCGNVDDVYTAMGSLVSDSTRVVVIDAVNVPAIDVTAVAVVVDLGNELAGRGIRLFLARDSGQVRDVLETAGGASHIDRFQRSGRDVVAAAVAPPAPATEE